MKLQEPIYTDRINATIRGLIEGKTRDELAEEFGLASWKSLDIYMRRKGFSWDSDTNTYNPITTKTDKLLKEVSSNIPVKAEQIIRKFQQVGKDIDPRVIAKDMGFDDHREMAEYMEQKGLVWNSSEGNYIEKLKISSNGNATRDDVKISTTNKASPLNSRKEMELLQEDEIETLLQYLPLMKILSENKERLLDLLMPSSTGNIPKYAVPGVPKTKSIYMSELLARLVTEFSSSKNLSQREIVEAAVIEYLRRYGYQLEVEKLLSKS